MAHLFVGTSGYNYDAWKGPFYPPKLASAKLLAYYADRFPAVEINYSFYRLPAPTTLRKWLGEVPQGFRFVLKCWQRITHQRRLKDTDELVLAFADTARTLGPQLGPILVQLPPNLKLDLPRLDAFLAVLPGDLRAAFEFRHPSWFTDGVYAALEARGHALCVAESAELAVPLVRTAPWGYLRLRREDYTPDDLATWAERLRGAGFSDDLYVFFKHEDDARGPAFAAAFAAHFPEHGPPGTLIRARLDPRAPTVS